MPIFTLDTFALAQGMLGLRSFGRMLQTAAGDPLATAHVPPPESGGVSAIVPVLDEAERLGPCLEGLCANGPWLREILVVDGGSTDGTAALVREFAARDARIVLLDAAPVPERWNGKAWGLQTGLAAVSKASRWVVTIDADVRPSKDLIASLVTHAARFGLDAFSAAPRQIVDDAVQGIVHPALLATLVYRFGLPGSVAMRPAAAQAAGQCFFAEREVLARSGAIERAKASRCEDVTIARTLIAQGTPVGFFEAGPLAAVAMYDDAAACLRNWPRSLGLHDSSTPARTTFARLLEVLMVQALPIPLALLLWFGGKRSSFAFKINLQLALARLGVLGGMRRAYVRVPLTYWLSPLADLPGLVAIARATARRRHHWRGRALVVAETESA